MRELTPRQREILHLIREWTGTTGVAPTRSEIARPLGLRSANSAKAHLQALAQKGMLDLLPGTARGIRLQQDEGLPILGRVAAGSTMLAQELSRLTAGSKRSCSCRARIICSGCAA